MGQGSRWSGFVTFTGRDGQTLSYSRRGSGSTLLVCVPGGPGLDPEAYFHGLELPGVELLVFAPRGTALSSPPPIEDGYRLVGYVEDLEDLRLHLGVDRLALYGNSYGGTVVLAYASACPDRVDRLIASNAPAVIDEGYERAVEDAQARLVAQIPDAAQRLAAADEAEAAAKTDPSEEAEYVAFRSSMACGVANEGPVEAAYLDRLCSAPTASGAGAGMWAEWREGLNLLDRLGSVTASTLLIAGELDAVVPPELVEQIAATIPNARYVMFTGAGHFVAVEAPDKFTSLVTSFLRPSDSTST